MTGPTVRSAALRRPLAALLALLLLLTQAPATGASAATSYDVEARYDVDVRLDWASRWVDLRTIIDVRNTAGQTIDRLELNTAAVKLGAWRNLRVRVDGASVEARVVGQTITVPLPTPLAAGASTEVFVGFKSRLSLIHI